MDARELETLIYKKSGLLGVSGISSDMRTLRASDEPGARGDRPLHLSDRSRNRLARGGAWRPGWVGVHRRHWPARREDAPGGVAGCAWLGAVSTTSERSSAKGGSTRRPPKSRSGFCTDEEPVIARHTAALLKSALSVNPLDPERHTDSDGFGLRDRCAMYRSASSIYCTRDSS